MLVIARATKPSAQTPNIGGFFFVAENVLIWKWKTGSGKNRKPRKNGALINTLFLLLCYNILIGVSIAAYIFAFKTYLKNLS